MQLPRGRSGGGGVDCEFGISRCKLLNTKLINSKVLLCSTGNCIQYPVINLNGKEYENIYIYVSLSHFIAEISTIL